MTPFYDDGRAVIFHGDCREILPAIPKVDVVLTDPPYALSGRRSEWAVTASVGTGLHLAATRVISVGAMLVMSATSGRGIEYTLGAIGPALPFNRLLVWRKPSRRAARVGGHWAWDTVAVLAFGRAPAGEGSASSIIRTGIDIGGETDHPAEVPLEVAAWMSEPFLDHAAVALDPFVGSGALLVPMLRAGRRVIGIDRDERWCETAARRFAKETG